MNFGKSNSRTGLGRVTPVPRNVLVSVAMATFNGERFLAAQLDSLVAQDYRPLEVVVCDDASVDSTFEILKHYEARYSGLFRIYRNNMRLGLVKNFEYAAGICKGSFIAFSDQDDVWRTDKISVLVRNIGNQALAHSDARMIDESGRVIAASLSTYVQKPTGETSFLSFLRNNIVTGCTSMIASRLLETAIPFWDGMIPDQWLALMAADTGGIAYVPDTLIDYRQHEGNTSGPAAAARAGGIHRKPLARFLETRRYQYSDILAEYGALYRFIESRLSGAARADFETWLAYFESFFEHRIRFRAFCFHAAHLRLFSRYKRLDKVLFDLVLSALGNPSARRENKSELPAHSDHLTRKSWS